MKTDSGFYAADLARVHASGFLDFTRQAAPEILRRLSAGHHPNGLVVEIGCGTGELAQILVAGGWRVLGVDIAPEMLRIARRKAVAGAEFRLADWRRFVPPPCDAVIAVGECFNYLRGARKPHEEALAEFFERAYTALKPGGIMLFDFLESLSGRRARRTFLAAGLDWVVSGSVSESGGIIHRRISTVRFTARGRRASREAHKQLRIGRSRMGRLLGGAGFRVRLFPGYGRARLPAGHLVVLAVKSRYGGKA